MFDDPYWALDGDPDWTDEELAELEAMAEDADLARLEMKGYFD